MSDPPQERTRVYLSDAATHRAQELVRESLGADLVLDSVSAPEYFSPRNLVARIAVGHPRVPSVIVKERRRTGAFAYDIADTSPRAQSTRMAYEAASLEFLATTDAALQFPRLLGADYELGVTVIEDLGEGATIVDLLLGTDARAATGGLTAFAAALGHIHAATAGNLADFDAMLSKYGDRPPDPLAHTVDDDARSAAARAAELGSPFDESALHEIGKVMDRLRQPGPLLAWTHGDTCPGHDRLFDDRCRFIDVEFGGFRHALYDLTYLYVAFPSCGIVGRLPPDAVVAATNAYRNAAVQLPGISDDDEFAAELSVAWTYWILWSLNVLTEGAGSDQVWGNATHRQRLIQRLEDYGANNESHVPALTAWALTTARMMQARWPATTPLPAFPAYGSVVR